MGTPRDALPAKKRAAREKGGKTVDTREGRQRAVRETDGDKMGDTRASCD
jgi:hypothetical protein